MPDEKIKTTALPLSRFTRVILPLIIFVTGLLTGLLCLYQYKTTDLFYTVNTVTDSYGFYETAKSIAASGFIGKDKFNQEPGYYYFLALIIKIFGENIFYIRLIQILIGALNIVTIYYITLRLFKSVRTAVISALLLAFSGVFIYYNIVLLRHFLSSFIMNTGILIFICAIEKPEKKKFFLSGLIFAVGFFTQPNIISLLAAALIIIFFFKFKKYLAYYAAGAAVVIILLAGRNLMAGADLFSFSNKGPAEFAAGHTLTVNGVGWVEDKTANEYAAKYKTLFNVMYNVVFDSLAADPIKYFGIQLNKLSAFFNNFEVPNNYNFEYFKTNNIHFLKFAFINFGIMFMFTMTAVISCIMTLIATRKKIVFNIKSHPEVLFYILNAVIFSMSVLAFYILSRFRFPLFVLLAPLAAFGLNAIINLITEFFPYPNLKEKKTSRPWNITVLKLLILIIFTIISGLFTFFYEAKGNQKEYNMALAYANDASEYLKRNEIEKAIQYYKWALQQYPAEAGFSTLIRILLQNNDFEQASFFSEKAGAIYPASPDFCYYKAFIAVNKQKYEDCIKNLLNLPDLSNFITFKYYNLAFCYSQLKDYRNSLIYWEKYSEIHPEDKDAAKNVVNIRNHLKSLNQGG